MRKNALLSILFVIIILFLSLPFCMGIVIQKKLFTELQQLNSQTIHSKIISYHRGWFTSKATVLLTFPTENLSSKWVINIQHGPLFNIKHVNAANLFGWALFHIKIFSTKASFAKFLPQHTIGNANIEWHFNNILTGSLEGLKLNYHQNRQGIVLQSPGIQADFNYTLNSKQISLHAIIGGLTAQWLQHNSLRILPSLFSIQGTVSNNLILLGSMQLHLPLITWQHGVAGTLLLQNFNLTSEHHLNQARQVNYLNKATIQLLSYRHRSYAPSEWSATGENLSQTAINKQRVLLLRWWQTVLMKKALFNPIEWKVLQQQLIAYYQTILFHACQVQQHATLNTSLGNVQMDFLAKHSNLAAKVKLQWRWQIAKPLAKLWLYYAYRNLPFKTTQMNPFLTAEMSTDNLLNRYQALGLLQAQGNNYISTFSYVK